MDFTQPFIESGLVVVAPVRGSDARAWAFLKPFSPLMWGVTAAFFLIVGSVLWVLEHRLNDDFRGPPRKQIGTILWLVVLLYIDHSNTDSAYILICRFYDSSAFLLLFFRFSFSTMFFAHSKSSNLALNVVLQRMKKFVLKFFLILQEKIL